MKCLRIEQVTLTCPGFKGLYVETYTPPLVLVSTEYRSFILFGISLNVVHFIVTCDDLSRDVGRGVDCLTSPKFSVGLTRY